jgi:hypothetical protein
VKVTDYWIIEDQGEKVNEGLEKAMPVEEFPNGLEVLKIFDRFVHYVC